MVRLSFIILTTFILFIPKSNFATIYTSNGNGAFGAAGTWIPAGGPPACGDTIYILVGDTVTIEAQQDFSACPNPMFIIIDGVLDFPVNGPKLRLPCGSGVIINAGGLITSSLPAGSGNANFLEICDVILWKKADGPLGGPAVLGTNLPIDLITFEAEIDNTSVKLTWKTASEINNDYFTIERSQNGFDFESIGDVPGSGNSNTLKEYELNDDSPLEGTSYYRLKQTDFDGKYEYFDIIAINFNKDDNGICTLHVYPNPCIGSCTIDLTDCPLANDEVDVELYDAFGKKIINRITPKSKDQDISFHLNSANNLAPGVYIVRASANGKKQSSKVVVN